MSPVKVSPEETLSFTRGNSQFHWEKLLLNIGVNFF